MDLYRKIVRPKDVSSILSEKEYKCVSLQAITNEAIKENNKKRLKELVEEINGHLADLRSLKEEKDVKNKEKCDKLIQQFQECLVKIVNNRFLDVLTTINQQLEQLQYLTDAAMKVNNLEELKRLAERMEGNLKVMNEIPEVKDARNSENGDKKVLEVVNKYTSLLNSVLAHVNSQGAVKMTEDNGADSIIQKQENPSTSNKIALTEVEQKFKQMRQRRLNRLSTFVNEQAKLSEERSRENSPKNQHKTPENSLKSNLYSENKSSGNSSQIPEKGDRELAIKSVQSSEILKPSLYKATTQEKLVDFDHEKVTKKEHEKEFKRTEGKPLSGFAGALRNSFGKGSVFSGGSNKQDTEKSFVQSVKSSERKKIISLNTQQIGNNNVKDDNENVSSSTTVSRSNSSRQDPITKSFAERQIENARNQLENPKPQAKSSSSARTTPPRTPTNIRKIFFNSFNSCVSSGNSDSKSIEDLPSEFKSPFERELKNVQLKSIGEATNKNIPEEKNSDHNRKLRNVQLKVTNVSHKSNSFNEDDSNVPHYENVTCNQKIPKVVQPKLTNLPLKKPVPFIRQIENFKQQSNIEELISRQKKIGFLEKSASQGTIITSTPQSKDTKSNEHKSKKSSWRSSLDYDSIMTKSDQLETAIDQRPSDVTITIKRSGSSSHEPPEGRCSFSTFRTSTDSIKDDCNAFDNPLYDFVQSYQENSSQYSAKLSRQNSVFNDSMLISEKTKELSEFELNKLDFVIEDNKRRTRKTSHRREFLPESNKFIILEPVISKLEHLIQIFRGLKRDGDYLWIDKLLSKYYVKVDEVRIDTTFDKIEKDNLLERLRKASKNLENKAGENEEKLKCIFQEQVEFIGKKYGVV